MDDDVFEERPKKRIIFAGVMVFLFAIFALIQFSSLSKDLLKVSVKSHEPPMTQSESMGTLTLTRFPTGDQDIEEQAHGTPPMDDFRYPEEIALSASEAGFPNNLQPVAISYADQTARANTEPNDDDTESPHQAMEAEESEQESVSVTDQPDEDPKVGLESEKGSYDTMPKAEEDTSAVFALETSTVSGQQLDAMEELIGTTEAVLIYADQERKKGHAESRVEAPDASSSKIEASNPQEIVVKESGLNESERKNYPDYDQSNRGGENQVDEALNYAKQIAEQTSRTTASDAVLNEETSSPNDVDIPATSIGLDRNALREADDIPQLPESVDSNTMAIEVSAGEAMLRKLESHLNEIGFNVDKRRGVISLVEKNVAVSAARGTDHQILKQVLKLVCKLPFGLRISYDCKNSHRQREKLFKPTRSNLQ
jgi:hypothetical protein